MGIALVIVGGLVLMTLAASGFSYLSEKRKRVSSELEGQLTAIEHRLSELEHRVDGREERYEEIERDVEFVHKLLSDKNR